MGRGVTGMTILKRFGLVATLVLATGLVAIPAYGSGGKECKLDAKEEKKECTLLCKEQFRLDKDLCRNVDHECAEECRADRQFCLYGDEEFPGPLTLKAECKDACKVTREATKESCRATFDEGTTELAECLLGANLAAWLCRRPCREGVKEAVKICRRANRDCIRACPPPLIP